MEWGGEWRGTAGSQQKMPHVIRSRNSNKSIFLKTEITTNQTCKSFASGLGNQELRRMSEDLLLFITHTHAFAFFDFFKLCACMVLIKNENLLKMNLLGEGGGNKM